METLDYDTTESEPRAFSNDFTEDSSKSKSGIKIKEEPTSPREEAAEAHSGDVGPKAVKSEPESGGVAVSKPPVKLGKKRSAAIASLQTPVVKQQR